MNQNSNEPRTLDEIKKDMFEEWKKKGYEEYIQLNKYKKMDYEARTAKEDQAALQKLKAFRKKYPEETRKLMQEIRKELVQEIRKKFKEEKENLIY